MTSQATTYRAAYFASVDAYVAAMDAARGPNFDAAFETLMSAMIASSESRRAAIAAEAVSL
jgi:hypothetical protein